MIASTSRNNCSVRLNDIAYAHPQRRYNSGACTVPERLSGKEAGIDDDDEWTTASDLHINSWLSCTFYTPTITFAQKHQPAGVCFSLLAIAISSTSPDSLCNIRFTGVAFQIVCSVLAESSSRILTSSCGWCIEYGETHEGRADPTLKSRRKSASSPRNYSVLHFTASARQGR